MVPGTISGPEGFFEFGPQIVCYGHSNSGVSAQVNDSHLFDASASVRHSGSDIHLPFDPCEVIENLWYERYARKLPSEPKRLLDHPLIRQAYYFGRGALPVSVRRHLQRAYLNDWQQISFPDWPIDFTVDTLHEEILRKCMQAANVEKVPFIWFWPGGAPNCLLMTHDVETAVGRDFSSTLMGIDDSYGFKAAFQVIPEKRYEVTEDYIASIRGRGFEFNVHDLNHDGCLFKEREEFLRRAKKINAYVHKYQARGFRAGAMYRNQDWFDAFEFSYDMSVPNAARLESQRGGCCTVMPYFIGEILELPLTTCQDYSLLHILSDYSLELWKQQLRLLSQRNGLMTFIVHPDYMIERRARRLFESLLDYLRQMVDRDRIWAPLPGDLDRWWRARRNMELVPDGNTWKIEGPQSERARLAYAVIDGSGRLIYRLEDVAANACNPGPQGPPAS